MTQHAAPDGRGQPFDLPHLCRHFSEQSPHPMLAVGGPTHVIRHANAAFLRLAGIPPSGVVGHPFHVVVPAGEADGFGLLLDRVYRTGEPQTLTDQKRGDDPPVFWSYTAWAIPGRGGRPAGVMIQVTDSTEVTLFRAQAAAVNQALVLAAIHQQELSDAAQALTAQLQAAIQEREYFIAVLSHELRTPLTPVLIAASHLQDDPRLEPDARDVMRMIHRNVTLESRLMDDLLDVTRLDRGKIRLDLAPVDLREAVERSVEATRADLHAGGLTLAVDLGAEPQWVEADAGRLQQVFTNLLRNAIKFTPPAGHVHVALRRDGDRCAVEVRDDGVGIDGDFIPRAFVAFEQAGKAHARKAGLGLGLAICKTIVDLHGGAITAHSDGKDRGATFVVRLPPTTVSPPARPEVKPPATPPSPALRPLRILLVEDDADTSRIMRWLLTADGHAVRSAGDVATALRLADAHDFDLLLSDLGLPDGTGVDLMRDLRARGSTLPGIVVSGYGQDQDVARSLDAGFSTHLTKPISTSDLRAAMATLIARSPPRPVTHRQSPPTGETAAHGRQAP